VNITCLPNATKPHKRKSPLILSVSTANLEPWALSGGLAPVFLNFRLLCKLVVTHHAQDNLGQSNESPVPTEYEVTCSQIRPLTLYRCFLLSFYYPFPSFPSLSCSTFFTCISCLLYYFHIFHLLYCVMLILVNDQLHALFCFSYICLFHFSTCFGQPSVRHQESQLYQYDLWYISFYVGDCVVHRFHPNLHTTRTPTHSDIYHRSYWYNWLFW